MEEVAKGSDAQFDNKCKSEGCSEEEWKDIYENMKKIKGFLITLQKDMPECTFVNDVIAEICDIEKKCD